MMGDGYELWVCKWSFRSPANYGMHLCNAVLTCGSLVFSCRRWGTSCIGIVELNSSDLAFLDKRLWETFRAACSAEGFLLRCALIFGTRHLEELLTGCACLQIQVDCMNIATSNSNFDNFYQCCSRTWLSGSPLHPDRLLSITNQ